MTKRLGNTFNIDVWDSPPASGKTTAAIDYMNEHCARGKKEVFLFVTPLLSECLRVINACPDLKFIQPDNKKKGITTKTQDLLKLVKQNANIVMTHSLFERHREELVDELSKKKYILFLDETIDVLNTYEIFPHLTRQNSKLAGIQAKKNVQALVNHGIIDIDSNTDIVSWVGSQDLDGYRDLKRLSERGMLRFVNSSNLLKEIPVELFSKKVFTKVFILTYLFRHSDMKYYFEIKKVSFKSFYSTEASSKKYKIVPLKKKDYDVYDISFKHFLLESVNVIESPKMNMLGDAYITTGKNKKSYPYRGALSRAWYEQQGSDTYKRFSQHLRYFYREKAETNPRINECIYASFKDDAHKFKGVGINTSQWLYSGTRATNEYGDRTALAYLINKYMRVPKANYFSQNGVDIDRDANAVSSLIQWIMRSALRHGEKIDLYIPSWRMRHLFYAFRNCEDISSIYDIELPVLNKEKVYKEE